MLSVIEENTRKEGEILNDLMCDEESSEEEPDMENYSDFEWKWSEPDSTNEGKYSLVTLKRFYLNYKTGADDIEVARGGNKNHADDTIPSPTKSKVSDYTQDAISCDEYDFEELEDGEISEESDIRSDDEVIYTSPTRIPVFPEQNNRAVKTALRRHAEAILGRGKFSTGIYSQIIFS